MSVLVHFSVPPHDNTADAGSRSLLRPHVQKNDGTNLSIMLIEIGDDRVLSAAISLLSVTVLFKS